MKGERVTRQRLFSIRRVQPLTILLALGLISGVLINRADVSRASAPTSLSEYWPYKIQQWDTLILQEAERRHLDPDFLASLVWMESRGDPQAVGPVGAVGLMQVMPKEAGFTWRPSKEELMDPGINLYWGTRTLATVVRQGKGDIFNSLAAYNGGWDQVMYRGPTIFASTILRDYAHAVATRLHIEGTWSAFFAVRGQQIGGPIRVVGSDREDVYLYGEYNWTPEGVPVIPDVAPTAVAAECEDEETGRAFVVGVWFYDHEGERWLVGEPAPAPTPVPPTPTPTLEPTSEPVAQTKPTSSERTASSVSVPPGLPHDLVTPTAVPAAPTPTTQAEAHDEGGTVGVMSFGFEGEEPSAAPPASTEETSTASTASLPMPTCAGGELTVSAWPMEREYVGPGWKARVFAQGRGGDCVYTYAWNDSSDIRGEAMTGPIVFEVSTDRERAVIVGTVVVTSGGQTERVGVYITPP
jgi:hypothetical protein